MNIDEFVATIALTLPLEHLQALIDRLMRAYLVKAAVQAKQPRN